MRGSVRFEAYNGNKLERAICGQQMSEAADEIERLLGVIEERNQELVKMLAVVDAVREYLTTDAIRSWNKMRDALRALDGEPVSDTVSPESTDIPCQKKTDVTAGVTTGESALCPKCNGRGRYGDPQHGHGIDCPTCGGPRRKG